MQKPVNIWRSLGLILGCFFYESRAVWAGSCSIPMDPEALGLNDKGFDTRWLMLALAAGLLAMVVARKRKTRRSQAK